MHSIIICETIVNVNSAQLGLLFVLQSYIRRTDLDGSNSVTLHSGGNPVAVDHDYRFDILIQLLYTTMSIAIYTLVILKMASYRNNYLFWSDISNRRIWRAELDGSNPEILISNDIQCVGRYLQLHRLR